MMKPRTPKLAVVTASLDLARARPCINSWAEQSFYDFPGVLVWNGATPKGSEALVDHLSPEVDHKDVAGNIILVRPKILGVVPAFALGVEFALKHTEAGVIACLHDDLLIEQRDWDLQVLAAFERHPEMGLCGFGGGTGLGHADIYQKGYSPYDLAREGFVSNMRDAEAHGRRVRRETRVACLDGFSQVGRREFWEGLQREYRGMETLIDDYRKSKQPNVMQQMADWGITHHAYDSALGAWAKRLGWEVWMLPIRCHHFGGQTAVGDPRYAEWAEGIVPGGDRTFWELAHKEVYERFRDVLPVRV